MVVTMTGIYGKVGLLHYKEDIVKNVVRLKKETYK